jgi:hypothetical protein
MVGQRLESGVDLAGAVVEGGGDLVGEGAALAETAGVQPALEPAPVAEEAAGDRGWGTQEQPLSLRMILCFWGDLGLIISGKESDI